MDQGGEVKRSSSILGFVYAFIGLVFLVPLLSSLKDIIFPHPRELLEFGIGPSVLSKFGFFLVVFNFFVLMVLMVFLLLGIVIWHKKMATFAYKIGLIFYIASLILLIYFVWRNDCSLWSICF